jgi:hypothetical protein
MRCHRSALNICHKDCTASAGIPTGRNAHRIATSRANYGHFPGGTSNRGRRITITALVHQYNIQYNTQSVAPLQKRDRPSNRLFRADSRHESRTLALGSDDMSSDEGRVVDESLEGSKGSVTGSPSKVGCTPAVSSSANNCLGLLAYRHAYVARPIP